MTRGVDSGEKDSSTLDSLYIFWWWMQIPEILIGQQSEEKNNSWEDVPNNYCSSFWKEASYMETYFV